MRALIAAIFLHAGAPYLEYKVILGDSAPEHMVFQAMSAQTLNISFNVFGSPAATVTLYRMQANGSYELYENTRITATDSYITINDVSYIEEAQYLITASNIYGSSINNLTFVLVVTGITQC